MTIGIGPPPAKSVPDKQWTDSTTGISYRQDNIGKWTQISSGGRQAPPANQAQIQSSNNNFAQGGISDVLSQIMNSPNNILQPNYPANSFEVTPFKDFYDKAFRQLAPYYEQLLKQSGGDLDLALTNLETDYKTGKRTEVENFITSMDTLGVQFPMEQDSLAGKLNERGIALTENPQGQTTYAGGGQSATEVGNLNTDQRLRAEAIQRNRQRGMETLAQKKLIGAETGQQQYRDETQNIREKQEASATNLGAQFQNADIAEKQAGIQRAQLGASTGLPSNSAGNIDPNDVNAIKAKHPGYRGWNDVNAILGDYRATGGVGK